MIPLIEVLVQRNTQTIGGQRIILISDINYQFDDNFTLVVLSKDKELLSSPQLFVECEILNFGLYSEGLQQRMAEIVLSIDKQDKILEELRNKQLVFERLRRLEENREIVLKRLNKHNDYTLLED